MTTLEKYNADEKLTKSEQIAINIMEDISDRRGLGNEWDQIDDSIKEEIINGWVEMIDNQI